MGVRGESQFGDGGRPGASFGHGLVSVNHCTMPHSYPNIAALMGGVFHQDWRSDHDSAEDVLVEEVFSQPVEDRRAFLDEVEAFLRQFTTEDAARAALRSTGTGFRARYDAGEDTLPWLRSLRSRLAAGLASEGTR